jgi:hypothetical protein
MLDDGLSHNASMKYAPAWSVFSLPYAHHTTGQNVARGRVWIVALSHLEQGVQWSVGRALAANNQFMKNDKVLLWSVALFCLFALGFFVLKLSGAF